MTVAPAPALAVRLAAYGYRVDNFSKLGCSFGEATYIQYNSRYGAGTQSLRSFDPSVVVVLFQLDRALSHAAFCGSS
jgi:hypothetical protein